MSSKARTIFIHEGKKYVPGPDQYSCAGCAFEDVLEAPCGDVRCLRDEDTHSGKNHIWVEKSE